MGSSHLHERAGRKRVSDFVSQALWRSRGNGIYKSTLHLLVRVFTDSSTVSNCFYRYDILRVCFRIDWLSKRPGSRSLWRPSVSAVDRVGQVGRPQRTLRPWYSLTPILQRFTIELQCFETTGVEISPYVKFGLSAIQKSLLGLQDFASPRTESYFIFNEQTLETSQLCAKHNVLNYRKFGGADSKV